MNVVNLNELDRNEDLNIRKLEDIYYFVIRGNAYEANEIGATIVNAVGRDMTIDELCSRIAKKYDNKDINQIKEDVNDYINYLLSEKIIIHNNSTNE